MREYSSKSRKKLYRKRKKRRMTVPSFLYFNKFFPSVEIKTAIDEKSKIML